MLQLRFQTVPGLETVHKLNHTPYLVRLTTVSPYCTVLCFLKDGHPVDVPPDFSMVIPNPNSGTCMVNAFQNRVFAMGHSATHLLCMENNKTLLCLSPYMTTAILGAQIIRSASNSPCPSLNSSEEVSRNEQKTASLENKFCEYIREEWGDCETLREEIEQTEGGSEAFYYSNDFKSSVSSDIYSDFVNDTSCWCGQCRQ